MLGEDRLILSPLYSPIMNRKPTLSVPTYSASAFSWRGKRGVCAASDLNVPVGAAPGRRVWPDSCDEGFLIHSPDTGVSKLFILAEDVDDFGGGGWTYRTEDGFEVWIDND